VGVLARASGRVAYAADVYAAQLAAAVTGATDAAPFAVRLVLLIVLLAIAATLGSVGYLGWRGRLAKDGRLGVRTASAVTDEESFALANRVAGLPTLVAGLIAAFAGAAAFGLPSATGSVVVTVIGLVGAIAVATAGGALGDRAAKVMLASKPTVPAQCVGCACGGCAALTRS
jgi:hypothetical protein